MLNKRLRKKPTHAPAKFHTLHLGGDTYINAADESPLFGTRFINCSKSARGCNVQITGFAEQNGVLPGRIRATRAIERGEELLMWYGDEYVTDGFA